jgi:ribosomal protein S27AE
MTPAEQVHAALCAWLTERPALDKQVTPADLRALERVIREIFITTIATAQDLKAAPPVEQERQEGSRCPVFRPDHNGKCLNCDEWMDAHDADAIARGEADTARAELVTLQQGLSLHGLERLLAWARQIREAEDYAARHALSPHSGPVTIQEAKAAPPVEQERQEDVCPRCGGSFEATGGKPTGPPYHCQKCDMASPSVVSEPPRE